MTALLVACLACLALGATSAQAAAPLPERALAQLYSAGLGRPIDPSGSATFGGAIAADCSYGLLLAYTSVLTSPEAEARLTTPEAKVRAVFVTALGHEPAPGFSPHVQSMLNGRPWKAVLTSILASPEASTRISSTCAGRPSSAARYTMGGDTDAIVKGLLDRGAADATGCVGSKAIIAVAKKIKVGGVPIGILAAQAGKAASGVFGKGNCASAARQFAAAGEGAALGANGEAVYWNTTVRRGSNQWVKLGGCDVYQRFDVGRTVMDFHTFEGTMFWTICPSVK